MSQNNQNNNNKKQPSAHDILKAIKSHKGHPPGTVFRKNILPGGTVAQLTPGTTSANINNPLYNTDQDPDQSTNDWFAKVSMTVYGYLSYAMYYYHIKGLRSGEIAGEISEEDWKPFDVPEEIVRKTDTMIRAWQEYFFNIKMSTPVEEISEWKMACSALLAYPEKTMRADQIGLAVTLPGFEDSRVVEEDIINRFETTQTEEIISDGPMGKCATRLRNGSNVQNEYVRLKFDNKHQSKNSKRSGTRWYFKDLDSDHLYFYDSSYDDADSHFLEAVLKLSGNRVNVNKLSTSTRLREGVDFWGWKLDSLTLAEIESPDKWDVDDLRKKK